MLSFLLVVATGSSRRRENHDEGREAKATTSSRVVLVKLSKVGYVMFNLTRRGGDNNQEDFPVFVVDTRFGLIAELRGNYIRTQSHCT